jgi:hypothetical protein
LIWYYNKKYYLVKRSVNPLFLMWVIILQIGILKIENIIHNQLHIR